MKIQKRSFTAFSSEPSNRFDFNYIKSVFVDKNSSYSYKELFEIVSSVTPKIIEDAPFRYAEIGNVTKRGEVIPTTLSYDDRNELNEDLFKKIEKGDIILPDKGNILISTIRPYLNKNVLIEDTDDQEKYPIYFTKAFLQIKPKINSKIFYYLLRTLLYQSINSVSRQGKGYPTLKEHDLKTIKFPKEIIDNLLDNETKIIKKIEEIEKEIKDIKLLQREKNELVDEVFAMYFDIDLQKVNKLDSQSSLKVNLNDINKNNSNVRSSYRWNKMVLIQHYFYENINCIEPLGKFIVKINNGWSPESIEGGSGIPVLGQEHLEFDGVLNISPTKATTKTKNNMNNFFIQNGDFFVSRGNTVGLVGIASLVEEEVDSDIIYPDLYIKVLFNEKVNPKYIALLFNSFFGRKYFKYVSKGKNQSMVKISKSELMNFYIPLPDIDIQNELIAKVEDVISNQNNKEKKIEDKQLEIEKIIRGDIIVQ